jgi:hypothetical protein
VTASIQPPAEHVHWLFGAGVLFVGLCLLAQAIVGEEVWQKRRWRAYLWPALTFLIGLLLWPVMVLFTSSTIHMLAHGAWAQSMMVAGAAELGLVRGKLRSPRWHLCMAAALALSGAAFLVHEANPWLFQRAAFLHHLAGWTLVAGALFPLGQAIRPRSRVFATGYALTAVAIAVILFCDRDIAPIFGHLAPLAGSPHR